MYISMMDYMKDYPSPKKSILIQNAIDDIIFYKKQQYGSGYDKKVKSLAKQIALPIATPLSSCSLLDPRTSISLIVK